LTACPLRLAVGLNAGKFLALIMAAAVLATSTHAENV
jgi:hypothetical protein